MASTVKDAILRGRKSVETVVEESRKKVENAVEGSLNTVETVVEVGLNTVETVVVKGRRTVESAVSLGRRTVEHALIRERTMQAAVLHGREDIRIESVPFPKAEVGELDRSRGRGTHLRNGPEGLSPRLSRAHDRASGALRARDGRYRCGSGGWRRGFCAPAIEWLRSTPLPAATVTFASATRKTSATTCSSTTAPTPSSSAFPRASWKEHAERS